MNPHSTLWPEHLGPRPDGIGCVSASPKAAEPPPPPPPPFPSSDYNPYAFRSGSPCGEGYNFGDADGQFYYYGHQPCRDGDQSIDPWLLALMEDLRELYVRRRHTFQQLFPKLHGEIDRKLEEALRSKMTRDVRAFPRSLSVGSPRLPGRDGGVGDEPALRLDRFKVRTLDLDDPVAESGSQQGSQQGGQGGNGGVASGGGGRRNGGM
ncbi:uncharacterized protein J3R85_011316 [Psidium guajava]|nr:uncharacterized protein J3R85_011316 [Psidium guajava]